MSGVVFFEVRASLYRYRFSARSVWIAQDIGRAGQNNVTLIESDRLSGSE